MQSESERSANQTSFFIQLPWQYHYRRRQMCERNQEKDCTRQICILKARQHPKKWHTKYEDQNMCTELLHLPCGSEAWSKDNIGHEKALGEL